MRVWHGPRGIQVEVITLDRKARLRVTQTLNGRTYIVGYYRDPRELTQHLDLAELVEVIQMPRRANHSPPDGIQPG